VLALRRMPALRFRYDPSIEVGSRTIAILKSLNEAAERGNGQDHGE
jgi:ribosome-binding factor A